MLAVSALRVPRGVLAVAAGLVVVSPSVTVGDTPRAACAGAGQGGDGGAELLEGAAEAVVGPGLGPALVGGQRSQKPSPLGALGSIGPAGRVG
ncbi:hypothetical protein [Actinomycetospora termitidis]|uniref:Secreted protein n=1 Tax=Actinomycetospora termitidis TaxID=3053470 RepID=A0ABT7MKJ7_9PSEU|nr:hypothetical protein [Actinomycetospora sp. Odt1-22]MDL5160497.1 hypothetical protein [Actinomycetospora sp. Odt1-22]